MKNNRFFLIRVLPVFITLFLLVSAAAAESGYEPFFRFDNGLDAWQNPLKNVRFLTDGAYTLTPLKRISRSSSAWIRKLCPIPGEWTP